MVHMWTGVPMAAATEESSRISLVIVPQLNAYFFSAPCMDFSRIALRQAECVAVTRNHLTYGAGIFLAASRDGKSTSHQVYRDREPDKKSILLRSHQTMKRNSSMGSIAPLAHLFFFSLFFLFTHSFSQSLISKHLIPSHW